MTFSEIDGKLMGSAGAIIVLARSWAEKYGFDWAYRHGKETLPTLVGWECNIPELNTENAYCLVIGRLIEQCERAAKSIWPGQLRRPVAQDEA